MNFLWILLIFILVLMYIISPIDGMPDLIPFFGWLDDTFLVGLLAYYLRYKRWPGFIYKLGRFLFKKKEERTRKDDQTSFRREKTGNGDSPKQSPKPRDAYEILGVTPDATPEDIQAAYRKAVQQYHPDKVAHLGKELQELANKKFVEIQDAYNILSKKGY